MFSVAFAEWFRSVSSDACTWLSRSATHRFRQNVTPHNHDAQLDSEKVSGFHVEQGQGSELDHGGHEKEKVAGIPHAASGE